jgi:hypothetical protein
LIRKFLHELVTEITKSNDKEATIKELMESNRHFADFIDLCYNKNYQWEFDSKYMPKTRNMRVRGGDITGWVEVLKLMRNTLLRNTNESPNFMRRLGRILESCNQKDCAILLCMLKNRTIKYVNTKKMYELFPELNKKEDETE